MARVNAGTLELPYLDSRGGAGPDLWYRVTAVNAGGAWGAASAPFRVTDKTLDDNLNSFAALGEPQPRESASTGATHGSSAATRPARRSRRSARRRPPGGCPVTSTPFETIAYYGSINDMHFTFQVSNNDRTWQGVPTSTVQAIQIGGSKLGDRIAFIYTLDNVQRILPGADYVRIVRHDGGKQVAEIGEVRITYR